MKNWPAALQAHIQERATSLGYILRIQRQDGRRHYLTNIQRPLTIGTITYRPLGGFTRTALSFTSTTQVDEFEFTGIAGTGGITMFELQGGAFDHAACEVAVVNFLDVSMGEGPIKFGHLKIAYRDNGTFTAEVRGLKQLLTQNLMEVIEPQCRVDLGGPLCGVPIYPDLLPRGAAVEEGQVYRVKTLHQGAIWENIVENANFELDGEIALGTVLTGWNVISGSMGTTSTIVDAFEGQYFLKGVSDGEAQQDIDLTTLGVNTANIDAGDVAVTLTYQQINEFDGDTGQFIVEALDGGGASLGNIYDAGALEILPTAAWQVFNATFGVPANTRTLRIRLIWVTVFGTSANVGWDQIVMQLSDRGAIRTQVPVLYGNAVDNGSFDRDGPGTNVPFITGWTIENGLWHIVTAPTADGTHALAAGDVETAAIYHDVDLQALKILPEAIDAGDVDATLSFGRANVNAGDAGGGELLGLDEDNNMVALYYDTGIETIAPINTYVNRGTTVTLTANTRKLRIRFRYQRNNNLADSITFDDVRLSLVDRSMADEGFRVYEEIYYDVTTAGVTSTRTQPISTTLPSTDGTAVLTPRTSLSVEGSIVRVNTLTDIFISRIGDPDDHYTHGAIIFDNGYNFGAHRIKSYTGATGRITLHEPFEFPVAPGTTFRIYPGCDKSVDRCIFFSNILRHRGSPYVPNEDILITTPDR